MAKTEGWEQRAIYDHEKVVKEFEAGKVGKKGGQMTEDSVHLRIAMYLLETGGGLTAAEIESDVRATRGTKWHDQDQDAGPLDIDAILKYMLAPGTSLYNSLNKAGGFGIMSYSVARMMDEQSALRKEGDKYYLWCQKGVDRGAKLVTAKAKLDAAKQEASTVESLKEEVRSSQKRVQDLKAELGGLGFFKFSEKKTLKDRIANAQREQDSLEEQLRYAELAESSLPVLANAYELARKECEKAFS